MSATLWVTGAATAVPDKSIVRLGFATLLATETVPAALPAAVGLKFTVTVAVVLGESVTFDPPVTVNPLPLTDTFVIVTDAVPESVSVTVCSAEFPTVRLPKLTFVELACSCEDAATPVPFKVTSIDEFAALLSTESVPCAAPAAAGTKLSDTVIDWFGVRVAGEPDVIVKPGPLTAKPEIVTFPGPMSVKTTDSDTGDPTVTFPKLTLVELALREDGVADSARPQPVNPVIPASARLAAAHVTPHAQSFLKSP